jgi:phosphate regulon transcriptional regulator PhoB
MKQLIAIVEDEEDIAHLVAVNLEKSGFETRTFSTGASMLKFIEKRLPDLVILDLMLPDMDGLEICKYLRQDAEFASVPVIMLTARTEETDRVLGLELGADDYVTKPFSVRELVARVKAVLRRRAKPDTAQKALTVGTVSIDPARHEVTVAGKPVELTATEFRILALLVSAPGRVFTRDQILDHLWGHEKAVIDRTVDVHIRNLRDKLGKAAGHVRNIRGVGYKVEK